MDDSNLSISYSTLKLYAYIPIQISLQFPFNQSIPQINNHLTLTLPLIPVSICALIFSYWALVKSERGRRVLSRIKQDYWIPRCGEGSRKREGRGSSQE